MANYIQLRNQILKLQKEAEILRKRERAETIAKIKEAIAAYELTAKDLGLSIDKRLGQPPKSAAAPRAGRNAKQKNASIDRRSVVAPKYGDSVTGASWTGRGKQPKWLTAAIKAGKKLEDFKI